MSIFRNPVIGLFFLAPLVAEFFLGDFPIYMLPLIIPLAFWYGSGAVFIREVTRRLGRGWPTMLLLGLAFGIVEEGLLTMSLFNPDYADLRLLDRGYVSALGIGILWTVFVLVLHPLWSIAAPIALIEESNGDRRTTPWLGARGLTVVGACLAIGAVVTFASNYPLYGHFVASVPQLVGSAVVAVVVAVVAVRLPRTRVDLSTMTGSASAVKAPTPWITFATTMICAGAFQVGGHSDVTWIAAPVMLIAVSVLAIAVARWSRSARWGAMDRYAIAAGLVLTYTWRAFFNGYGHGTAEVMISLVSYVVYAIAAVMILRICARRMTATTRYKVDTGLISDRITS